MDSSLRSLLTSLARDLPDTEASLSEIAKAVLAGEADGSSNNVREKAGLLALLNLLGIVDTFYGEESPDKAGAVEPPASGDAIPNSILASSTETTVPQVQAQSQPPVGPVSIAGTLAKLLGGTQSPSGATEPTKQESNEPAENRPSPKPEGVAASAGTVLPSLTNILSSADPSMIASMLGMVASMARQLPAKGPIKVEQSATGSEPSPGDEAQVREVPSTQQPSPLHQLLGVDPKIITLILNVAAEFMKQKGTEPKEKSQDSRGVEKGTSAGAPAQSGAAKAPGQDAMAVPPSPRASMRRPETRAHRPGLGIQRNGHTLPKEKRPDVQ